MGNIYSTVSYDAQINKLALPLNCSANGLQTNVPFEISTTAPLTAGAGHAVYYADVGGTLTLDGYFIGVAEGATSWQVDLTVQLLADNASPQVVTITQSIRQPTNNLVFNFAANGTNSSVGPLVQASAGISDLKLGEVDFGLTLYSGNGLSSGRTNFICPADTPAKIVSSIAVDTSNKESGIVSNGGISGVSVPSDSKYTLANIPASCNLFRTSQQATTYPGFNFSIAGIVPDFVAAGSSFNVTDVVAFLTLPPNVTYGLDAGTSSSPDPVDIRVVLGTGYGLSPPEDGLILNVMNAQPSTYDAARTDPQSQTRPGALLQSQRLIPQNGSVALPMPLPVVGDLSLGPFIAGSSGSVVSFSVSKLNGYLDSTTGAQIDMTCQLDTSVDIFSIPVA